MQETSPNRKRSGRSDGKAAATKSRRPKTATANPSETPETRNSILARLDLLDTRLSEALTSGSEKAADLGDSQMAVANEQVLTAVVNQGKAIAQISAVLEAMQGSIAEMAPLILDRPAVEVETTDSGNANAVSQSPEANDDTQTQSWEAIKEAMLGESQKAKVEEVQESEPDVPDEEVLFDFVSQADVDQLNEDGLKTLIIDQERIISRLVRRVQQKSRRELQLTPEQLHDCAKNLPEELAVRVETTLKTLDEQARLGELELSLERARISRQLSHLDETREIIEANARSLGLEIGPEGKIEGSPGAAKRNGSKGRRWLGALGFGD